jgi:metal-sulfur cluster biosynthetic enzyme
LESELTKRVTEMLNDLVDEETLRRFGELNLVTEVTEMASGSVRIKFQPLSPYSPLAVNIGRSIRDKALSVEGVKAARVECSGHMMDDLVNRLVNKEPAKPKLV